MEHPQLAELTNYLVRMLDRTGSDYVVVQDPERNTRVDFLFNPAGEPSMRLILTNPKNSEVSAAKKLGLPEPEPCEYIERYGANKGNTVRQLWYWCPVLRLSDSAALSLAIMSEVYGTRADAWLWITDIYEPDEWPDPLPKPEVWPPK